MLFIALNWIYVFFITFTLGYAISSLSGKLFGYRLQRIDSILMAGLVMATVYAQVFSLFYRVSLLANVILVVYGIAVLLVGRKDIRTFLRALWQETTVPVKGIVGLLFLFWAYNTSRGYMVPDTQLYHAQAIRFIEEYGIIPGQGILNARFSYNSSFFSLSALFSLKYVFGQSMHAMSGWMAFVLSISCLEIRKGFRRLRLSDFARIAGIYYLTLICDEVLAPSSDYASMCTIFFLIITWLHLLEQREEEQHIAPYGLLCVLGVFALTLKLTAGLVLVLTIKPAVELIRTKQWKQIFFFLGLGLLVAAPWMIRSVLISGWLIYPLALDLFDVPWKQLEIALTSDATSIKTWARGTNATEYTVDDPIWKWYAVWMGTLSAMEKALALAAAAAIVLGIVGTGVPALRKRWFTKDLGLIVLTLIGCYTYWQLSAPMPRYGYAYLLLLPIVVFGIVIQSIGRDRLLRWGFVGCGAYKIVVLILGIASSAWYPAYIRQVDYYSASEESVYTVTVDGYTFYRSNTESLGYAYFPEGSAMMEFELMGEKLEDGLRWKVEE